MNVTVTVNDKSLNRLAHTFPIRIDRGIARIAYTAEKEAVRNAPVLMGSLRSSIGVLRVFEGAYLVFVNARSSGTGGGAPYDAFQELGTGLHAETFDGQAVGTRHRIYPRKAKLLVFEWKGRTWHLPSVEGVKPVHYMRAGRDAAIAQAQVKFNEGFMSL